MKDDIHNEKTFDGLAKEMWPERGLGQEPVVEASERSAVFTESFFRGVADACVTEPKALVLMSGVDVDEMMVKAPDGTMRHIAPSEIEEGMTIVIPCEECMDMITGDSLGYGDHVEIKAISVIEDNGDIFILTENGALSTIDFSEVIDKDINFPDILECGDIIIGDGLEQGDREWEP